jgi:hypothetical protein
MRISSIDVWLVAKSECILDLNQAPFVNACAHLWRKEDGDPSRPRVPGSLPPTPFKGKFAPGTYVFPFEFPALPRDVEESQMDHRIQLPVSEIYGHVKTLNEIVSRKLLDCFYHAPMSSRKHWDG